MVNQRGYYPGGGGYPGGGYLGIS